MVLKDNPYLAPAGPPAEPASTFAEPVFRAYVLGVLARTVFGIAVPVLGQRYPSIALPIFSLCLAFLVGCFDTAAHWTLFRATHAKFLLPAIVITIVAYAYSAYRVIPFGEFGDASLSRDLGPDPSVLLYVLSTASTLSTILAYLLLAGGNSAFRWFRWLALAKGLLLLSNSGLWLATTRHALASNLWMLVLPLFIFTLVHLVLMIKAFWNLNLGNLAQTSHN